MFTDNQELRRVHQVLSECSPRQIIQLLREAGMGVNRDEDGIYSLDFRSKDECSEDDED